MVVSVPYILNLLYVYIEGQDTFTIGSYQGTEGPSNTSNNLESGKASFFSRPLEPYQSSQEPSYWGITFPTRIEILYSNPHHATICRSLSKDDSIKSLVDDEGM